MLQILDKFDLLIQEDVEDSDCYTSDEINYEVEKRISKLFAPDDEFVRIEKPLIIS